jgi:hypothetical protein
MGISCLIEIEDVRYKPRAPYVFACLPRIGETVSLEWEDDKYPKFIVYRVIHVPDAVQDKPPHTILHVRRV